MNFEKIIEKYRKDAFSERDKGNKFEVLIKDYLLTDRLYSNIDKVWLWNEFPARKEISEKDTGIDLVAHTKENEYWSVQCKFYEDGHQISKPDLDSFLSLSSKNFSDLESHEQTRFHHCILISTTDKWNTTAEDVIKNRTPDVSRLMLSDLAEADVDWEKIDKGIYGEKAQKEKKKPRDHQKSAIEDTHEYFKKNNRGKLIMACGTGKTFTSLCIAEKETNNKGLVLYMVPSIALLGQTLREWTGSAKYDINPICICSDSKVTKKISQETDYDIASAVDLALPASTNAKTIVKQLKRFISKKEEGMTVVFCTYQSIQVVCDAQKMILKDTNNKEGIFDLIICDEAHRTTGYANSKEEQSEFVKIHDDNNIKAKKRLYMTATPRIYNDNAKAKAAEADDSVLYSMDDVKTYGDEIYRIGFGEAVEKDLLSDYKVLILTVNDRGIPNRVKPIYQNKDEEINADDVSKLIGCIKALNKKVLGDDGTVAGPDPSPMKRAVAFCQTIATSKMLTDAFNKVSDQYIKESTDSTEKKLIQIEANHVDGGMSAPERDRLIQWLKKDDDKCHILSNVRCLSEGVDVPSLDAILFLSAKNSQIDVVQSVGRVMRKAPGKKYGYIIIPILVSSDAVAEKVLDNNENYKVVWTVLNALRAHDERFNATVNQINLNKKRSEKIVVVRPNFIGDNDFDYTTTNDNQMPGTKEIMEQAALNFDAQQNSIYAKLVQKVGDRTYWDQWAAEVSGIAERQIGRIKDLVNKKGEHQKVFDEFLKGLQSNINPSIDKEQAIEMLSQHIITRPIFEALFGNYSFAQNNPISVSMQKMLDLLDAQSIEKDTAALEKFYASVRRRVEGIDNAEGKQNIIKDLYEKFFKTAFKKMVDKLGIVYTPVEVVDFINSSVAAVLKKEFERNLSDENVHILDPFVGTGTFITRLIQTGLIDKEALPRKYAKELHANEIVLLAYYIASINIENAYHDTIQVIKNEKSEKYVPFQGICLTDTFQLGESEDPKMQYSDMLPENSDRVIEQKKAPIRIIIGNPPYSVGQKSANDDAKNQTYTKLEKRIEKMYVESSNANLNKAVYDSYIKAFRWATDRLDPKLGGIIGFVSNGAWIDSNGLDGFRKCIEQEFAAIYIFNLRGNCRTQGELRRKEAGNIFGLGSRTPIAITILVQQPNFSGKAKIHYYDIGDYLSREKKLKIIHDFGSITKLPMKDLHPNEHGDWINQRNNKFSEFIPIEPEKKFDVRSKSWFNTYVIGVATNRDSWVIGFSKEKTANNMKRMIDFYNEQTKKLQNKEIKDVENSDSQISWTRALRKDAANGIIHKFNQEEFVINCYRPFCKQNLYYHRPFIESPGLWSQLFPIKEHKNLVIAVSGIGQQKEFSSLITQCISDLQVVDKAQYFPLYYYEEKQKDKTLFSSKDETDDEYIRHDAISDFIFDKCKKQYGKKVSKEDIFYYVYGILHSPQYRIEFAADLKKMLPKIPFVDDTVDFYRFVKAGRDLADLHLNYEDIPPYADVVLSGDAKKNYHVDKMRFIDKEDKTSIQYNSDIKIENIPSKAYDYVVNGKSAIEWIMERYQIKTDKASGITNDPNDWAKEQKKPRYILDLLLSIINVSVQTVDIVNKLPKLEFGEK